jgi:membrane-associated phospholipid phosphatase
VKSWFIHKIYLHSQFFAIYSVLFFGGALLLFLFGDSNIFLWINSHLVTSAGHFAYWATLMGEGLFFALLVLVAAIFKLRWSLNLLVAHGFASIISSLCKHVLFKGAPRPKSVFAEESLQFVEGVVVHSWNSFPSGHTITAFCIFTVMVLVVQRPRFDLLWLVLAVLVGASRIILSQHFLKDVLVGSLIGLLSAMIAIYYTDKLRRPWLERSIFQVYSQKKEN